MIRESNNFTSILFIANKLSQARQCQPSLQDTSGMENIETIDNRNGPQQRRGATVNGLLGLKDVAKRLHALNDFQVREEENGCKNQLLRSG